MASFWSARLAELRACQSIPTAKQANQTIANSLVHNTAANADADLEGPLHPLPQPNTQPPTIDPGPPTMFLQRSAVAVARRAAAAPVLRRSFATTVIRRECRVTTGPLLPFLDGICGKQERGGESV